MFTDPPYFGNVQYADELMEFCYVWLRRLAGESDPAVLAHTVRDPAELTGNATLERGEEHFTDGLSRVFRAMAAALKPGGPLAFTYHHNQLSAYRPLVVAVLDAGLVCTRVLPCPAEMGGSIHINGTQSSVVDSVFVCRKADGLVLAGLPTTARQLAAVVSADLCDLVTAGLRPSAGDALCIISGHLARLAVARLRAGWSLSWPLMERLRRVASAFATGIDASAVKRIVDGARGQERTLPLFDELRKDLQESTP